MFYSKQKINKQLKNNFIFLITFFVYNSHFWDQLNWNLSKILKFVIILIYFYVLKQKLIMTQER